MKIHKSFELAVHGQGDLSRLQVSEANGPWSRVVFHQLSRSHTPRVLWQGGGALAHAWRESRRPCCRRPGRIKGLQQATASNLKENLDFRFDELTGGTTHWLPFIDQDRTDLTV